MSGSEEIIVHIYYTGVPGKARAFPEEMIRSGLVRRIRAEEGNLGYEYFLPMEDPETVLLTDRWKDQSCLDSHHASSMMEQIREIRETYDLHMRVERYRVDEAGVPAGDWRFIRE